MTRPSRRTLLGSTATLIGLSAGCIADDTGSPAGDDDDRNDADEGSPSADADPESTDGESEDLPDGLTDYETLAYRYGAASPESTMTVLRTADAVTDWLDDRESLPDSAAIDDFVDETDFETSILVSLEGDAPNPCYELVLESIAIEESDDGDGEDDEEMLVLEGTVRDTSAEDEACVQSLATVGRLVRATFDSEPLTTVSASVAGHNGSSSGASSGSDSASASESTSTDSASGSGSDGQSDDGS